MNLRIGLWSVFSACLLLLTACKPQAEEKRAETFKECAHCPEMQPIPSGVLDMYENPNDSSKKWFRSPTISVPIKKFSMATKEITYDQWEACFNANACGKDDVPDFGWGRGDMPVSGITLVQIELFLDWINSQTSGGYRLPSSAEWEYAAVANTDTRFWWGDVASRKYMNYGNEDLTVIGFHSDKDGWKYKSPVGSFPKNPFGLFDMNGNVSELVGGCHKNTLTISELQENELDHTCYTYTARGGNFGAAGSISSPRARIPFPASFVSVQQMGFRLAK